MGNMQSCKIIAHCHKGLENAQATIRFVDTKSGVLFTLGAGLLGYQLNVISKVLEANPLSVYCIDLGLVSALGIVILTLACLGCSLVSLLARTRNHVSNMKFIVVFPFTKDIGWDEAFTGYSKQIEDLDENVILKEYADQLTNLAYIIGEKIRWHRMAVLTLAASVFSTVLYCLLNISAI